MRYINVLLAASVLFDSILSAPVARVESSSSFDSIYYPETVTPHLHGNPFTVNERHNALESIPKVKGGIARIVKPGRSGSRQVTQKELEEDAKKKKEKDIAEKKKKLEDDAERIERLRKEKAERAKQWAAANPEREEANIKNPERKEVVTITSYTAQEIRDYLDGPAAQKKYMGNDKKGYTRVDDMAAAFEECVESGKFLFWGSGGSKLFRTHAIPRYEQLSGRVQLRVAAASKKCKDKGVGPIDRSTLLGTFETVKIRKAKEEWRKANPKKKKDPVIEWNKATLAKAKGEVQDLYLFRMSEAYAKAASGTVYYLRPDRKDGETGDRKESYWVRAELPALRQNKKHQGVWEVTMRVAESAEDYKDMDITPQSEKLRLAAPAA